MDTERSFATGAHLYLRGPLQKTECNQSSYAQFTKLITLKCYPVQVWFVYPGHVADIHQYAAFRPLPRVYTDITLQLLKMTHYPEKWQA